MAEGGTSNTNEANYPDRKAHANLAQVENQLLAGLSRSNPNLVEADGSCPQCVSLEHELADEYHGQEAAAKLTET